MFEVSESENRTVYIKGESYTVEGTIEGGSNGFSPLVIIKRRGTGRTFFSLIYDLELEELIELLEAMLTKLREQ